MTLSPQEIARRIAERVDANREQLLADTTRLIQFRTVSGGSEQEEAEYRREIPACLEWLKGVSQRMGFEFRTIEGVAGEISWKHPDPDAPVVGVAAHIDVVTVRGEWTHPPFSGAIADGHLWGRGTQDDKGPLMQSLYGMLAMKEAGIQPPCTINLIIGTKEETGDWSDMEIYLRNAPAPVAAFTPDADFPIINGEKGMISVVISAEWPEAGIDAETGMEFVSLVGGERENIVPSGCEIAIRFPRAHRTDVMKELVRTTTEFVVENAGSNITLQPNKEREIAADRHESVISFVGKSAHASTPEKGHNAIVDAVQFLKDIETFPEAVRRFCAFLHFAGAQTDGEPLGLKREHDFIGATTVCLALADIRANGGRALLNIRPTMGLTAAETLEKCREAADAFGKAAGISVKTSHRGEMRDAIFLDPSEPRVAPFIAALREGFEIVTGEPGDLRAIGGTTYAKAIPNCCAFGSVLDEPELAHQTDERMPVESIVRNAKIYGTSLGLLAIKGLK